MSAHGSVEQLASEPVAAVVDVEVRVVAWAGATMEEAVMAEAESALAADATVAVDTEAAALEEVAVAVEAVGRAAAGKAAGGMEVVAMDLEDWEVVVPMVMEVAVPMVMEVVEAVCSSMERNQVAEMLTGEKAMEEEENTPAQDSPVVFSSTCSTLQYGKIKFRLDQVYCG